MGSQCRYAGFVCTLRELIEVVTNSQVMLPPTLGDSSNMFILSVNQLKVSSSPGVLNPAATAAGLPSMVSAGARAAVAPSGVIHEIAEGMLQAMVCNKKYF